MSWGPCLELCNRVGTGRFGGLVVWGLKERGKWNSGGGGAGWDEKPADLLGSWAH